MNRSIECGSVPCTIFGVRCYFWRRALARDSRFRFVFRVIHWGSYPCVLGRCFCLHSLLRLVRRTILRGFHRVHSRVLVDKKILIYTHGRDDLGTIPCCKCRGQCFGLQFPDFYRFFSIFRFKNLISWTWCFILSGRGSYIHIEILKTHGLLSLRVLLGCGFLSSDTL